MAKAAPGCSGKGSSTKSRCFAATFIPSDIEGVIQEVYCNVTFREVDIQPWLIQSWGIPPKQNAAFVAAMEDIPSVYERPADERFPLVCLDEFCKQLLVQVAAPLPVTTGAPARHDYEYVREGSATAFMI